MVTVLFADMTALATALELGDHNLASMALDALGGNATSVDDFLAIRDTRAGDSSSRTV